MLVFNPRDIGNKLLIFRKRSGLTQSEVAEAAGLSDRTYADIERGSVNMRTETMLKICSVLRITPDNILTEEESTCEQQEELWQKLISCTPKERETAFKLLSIYLESLQ